ncbi:COR domain-containing protein [Thiofilum flexile]|uniref:ADP-ribosylation factor-like protein n=1 Tax=Thiofilum flexile TaxID=125627 RepID=UPI00038299BC|nr:COR domain-containing protein [Thiofilum flexile]
MVAPPTRKDLRALYYQKGHDALVWYAWRNALRALPALGHCSIRSIWAENTVRHVVAICRVPLILAQWANAPKEANAANTAINAATFDATKAANANNTTQATYAIYTTNAATNTAANIDYAVIAATNTANPDYAITAWIDYNLLKENHIPITTRWYKHPLWQKIAVGEATLIKQDQQAFDRQLRDLDLKFLADDLKNIFENKPLGLHAINYLKNISEAELNNPVALRRIILEGEGESIHAVRVLLLGPGGAGKSSLADRLQGKPVNLVKKLTVGVDYLNHQPLNLHNNFNYLSQNKKLDLYLWDFGGQTIFHGLHSAFLHENCVYVLVVDSRHEQAPDEWLHQIRHLTGGRTKVLLVTNWYEGCETRQNETRLLREFPDILDTNCFFYFSCHEPDKPNFQTFVEALEKASLDSQRMVLKEMLKVHEALKRHYQQDIFLDATKLRNIIKSNANSEPKVVVDKLQQLGFLVKVDRKRAHYCLKPEWAVDNAYKVLYSKILRDADGVLTLDALLDKFEDLLGNYTRYLVDFLETRSLCCDLNRDQEEEDATYFFPDAAPADEPKDASTILQETANGLKVRFDLPYLPLGFHARLIKKLFKSPDGIKNEQDIWRQGFILRRGESSAVVHYLTRKSIVELVLDGSNWQDLSELLNTLLVNLKAVLLEGQGMREEQIVPSVVLDQQVFSVHSAETLVEVLGQIKNYGQLIQEVKKMASTGNINVTNGQVIVGNNNTQKNNSDNNTVEISADQRQQLSMIVGELLKNAATLNPNDLPAVALVNQALAAPEKPESRNLLGTVWNGLKEAVDFTKTSTEIASFAMENGGTIASLMTAAIAALR